MKDIKTNNRIDDCIASNYEVYFDGDKVDTNTIDLKDNNYSVEIDDENKNFMVTKKVSRGFWIPHFLGLDSITLSEES